MPHKQRQSMAFSKDGKHFFNPARAREHDRNAAAPKPGDNRSEGGHVEGGKKTEYFSPDHPENPSPGKHHVVVHHADGSEEHSDHESHGEAHDHARNMTDEGQGDGGTQGSAEEGVCPDCGGAMVDGKCEECGYEEAVDVDGDHDGDGADLGDSDNY